MLQQIFGQILHNWPQAIKSPFTDHPIANLIRQTLRDEIAKIVNIKYPDYEIKASAGAGNWANVPWVSILNPKISKTTQDGIYPVFLFRPDGSGMYLSLNQGTTQPQKDLGKTASELRAVQLANHLRNEVDGLNLWGVKDISLHASTPLGKSYEIPNIIAKFYDAQALPNDNDLESDLYDMLDLFEKSESAWRTFEKSGEIRNDQKSLSVHSPHLSIPKAFILLAGISGTGKSRYVREQAKNVRGDLSNYCLIPVRPDWHEPSDLLGYVSNINGRQYVVTDLLCFIVNAWKNATKEEKGVSSPSTLCYKDVSEMTPYWLCLDEMNLAPVEQYFADFLSVIETRTWEDGTYRTDAIIKPKTLTDVKDELELRKNLGLSGNEDDYLFNYFKKNGIPLPPNLIVVGTVNMDETTHGFSRKVIDRALTIDFGSFFPNDFSEYFKSKTRNKTLSFPLHSSVSDIELNDVAADKDGQKSIQFLSAINTVLKDTPFELAFRALNELLISVACFKPKNDKELQAVWDDFLMTKVLPRIDGDTEKLRGKTGAANLLDDLSKIAQAHLSEIWDSQRPDLLRENVDDTPLNIDCHSKKKIAWMSDRLAKNSFTSFWP